MTARALARGLAVAAALWAVGCGSEPERATRPKNVVLLTLDTTRPDQLGCYGNPRVATPNLDSLAREGMLFERAFTPVPSTLPAHASILTGMLPARHGVHDNGVYQLPDSATTLAEMLAQHGYATAAFVSAFVLDAQFGLAQGFDHYDGKVTLPLAPPAEAPAPDSVPEGLRRWYAQLASPFERTAQDVTRAATAWLAGAGDRPFFLWVHYFDPHEPYRPPDPWRTKYDPGYEGPLDGTARAYHRLLRERGLRRGDPAAQRATEHMIALYDGEISAMDEAIGALLDALRQHGRLDQTLVVVVGDHGEAFGEHEQIWEHNGELYDEVMHVPLLIRRPEGRSGGQRVRELVSSIDVAPTVLDALGIAVPAEIEGRSLLAGAGAHAARSLLLEARRGQQVHPTPESLLGLRTDRHKLILHLTADDRVLARALFDLATDPAERQRIASREPALTDSLEAEIRTQQREAEANRAALPARGLDKMTSDALRALGYIDE